MFSAFGWYDLVGVVGTTVVVLAYMGTQLRWMNSEDLSFPAVNLLGSLLISISLYYNFNLASALMEGFWIVISLFGIWQSCRRR